MKLLDEHQQDSEYIIETVLNWMDTHNKWLFIYDNVNSISLDTPWWPRNNRNNILITTKNSLNHIKEVSIKVFAEEEAISFLEKRTETDNCTQSASTLANRLGYLPLALEQAAAYIVANKISFDKYLYLLDKCGLRVLKKTMERLIICNLLKQH